MKNDFLSFTSRGRGLHNVLVNECGITQAFDPNKHKDNLPHHIETFNAIWDTGATNCSITQGVADICQLFPIGMVKLHGAAGSKMAETYLVNIYLPNGVAISNVHVTKAELIGADILIGMDIINQSDFAVTNFNGNTMFSFRMPSKAHIDFVRNQTIQKRKKASQKIKKET